MKIELHKIKVGEVVAGYKDKQEEGVVAFTQAVRGETHVALFCADIL